MSQAIASEQQQPQHQQSDLTLPSFFPLIDKKKVCLPPAKEFFDCFTIHSKQTSDSYEARDPLLGEKGLAQCKKQLEAYSNCMMQNGADKDVRLKRVSEAYIRDKN